MSLKGSTTEFPLDVLIRLLRDQKKTGELHLRGDAGEGALGLAEGRVVVAVFGDEQPIPALGAIFEMSVAEFEFTAWDEAPPPNLEGDLDELLRKAREHREWMASVREVIPTDRTRFRLSERAAEQGAVTFTSERWRVVLAVNGVRDVTEIASILRIDRNAALNLLSGLVREGVIDTVEPPEDAAATPFGEPAAPPMPEPEPASPPAPEYVVQPAPPEPEDVAPPPPAPEPMPPDWETPPPPVQEVTPEPQGQGPLFGERSEHAAARDWDAPTPPEPVAPAAEPEPAPAMDDRLAALFGPPTEAPTTPAPDQWGAPPASTEWSTPARAADHQWTAPATEAPPPDATADPRLGALKMPPAEPAAAEAPAVSPYPFGTTTPPPNEWAPPPTVEAPPQKRRGLFARFGGGAKEPAAATAAMPNASVGASSRVGQLAAFSNALLSEYNSGNYGKQRIDDRMPSLLMRVDEQADPIDRPLPVLDDRLDVEALERVALPEVQAAPYLATLVTTIYADAEKAFGKDKAKKGYKAAQLQVFAGDASALVGPDLSGKLPKV